MLVKARALPPSEHEQRHALFDEAAVHVGLAQVAATMESHLRTSLKRENAWLVALGNEKSAAIQTEAEVDEPEAGG